jgi:hypothetical protein
MVFSFRAGKKASVLPIPLHEDHIAVPGSGQKLAVIYLAKSPVTSIGSSVLWVVTMMMHTSEGFWMNLQLRWDLYHAQREEAKSLKKIQPYHGSRTASR